ncbi:phage tail-collar fiber domain-containing protein [Pseudomonas pseudonitroreducens]|uniref:phage tail-collar fiber domain-containing protein n=1 Tax=Pseudomonas pseudonitroreducens TaxID=2892326 RepID=UPI001F4241F6|nr:phage tail protein [Pseudomonas pseudonitroreducens]
MAVTYYALLTTIGAGKLANATALGTTLKITQLALGDGGGNVPTPDASRTQLVNEVRRAPLNRLSVDPANSSQIIAEQVIPEDVGGWWIREMGLYDEAGALIAYANCAPSYKPQLAEGSGRTQTVRIVLIVSNAASVELKIDPSVVLATREYVDNSIVTALNRLDYKQSVRVATTASITLSGLQTVDGVVLKPDYRVLVKNQNNASQNGIYIAATGGWARSADADENADVTPSLTVPVESGTQNADTVWQLITDAPIVVGTTALTFRDITDGLARLLSPTFTGSPTAPTPAATSSDTSIATTAFVSNQLALAGWRMNTAGPTMTDANDTTVLAGFYNVPANTNGLPLTLPGAVLHKVYGTAGFQMYSPYNADRLFYRRRINSWQGWQELSTTSSVSAALASVGFGLSTNQPSWPNTSLNDCTGVTTGVWRTIATTIDYPGPVSTHNIVEFYLRDAISAGQFNGLQVVHNIQNNRRYMRTALGAGTISAPNWGGWKEVATTESPVFTGAPSAPTPAQFDSDASLATTEFVQRALGNLAGLVGYTSTSALSAADAGKIIVTSSTLPITLTLPALSSVPVGAVLTFLNTTQPLLTVVSGAGDALHGGSGNITSCTLGYGDNVSIVRGSVGWTLFGGSAQLKYSGSMAAQLIANGYQKLPSGLIIQWGSTTVTQANTWTVVNLPVPFTMSSAFQVICSPASTGQTGGGAGVSKSQIQVACSSAGGTVYWLAMGV